MADEDLKEFNLVGGTALALLVGHWISIDIDLFTDHSFEAEKLGSALSVKYRVDNLEKDNNTVNCFIEDIKVDCIAHCYPWIQPAVVVEGIRMASIEDIAAMKFNAIVQDGSRLKDFIDIYVLLEHKSLAQLLACYEQKYPNVSAQTAGKALLYHNDVKQTQKLDLVNQNITWRHIVKRLRQSGIDSTKVFKPENELLIHQKPRLSRGKKIR
jgi:hypothetical protein